MALAGTCLPLLYLIYSVYIILSWLRTSVG